MRTLSMILTIGAIALAITLVGSNYSVVQAAGDQVITTGESAPAANVFKVLRYGGVGVGYRGRWGGVFFSVPLGGYYGGPYDYYGRPYGYEEECEVQGGVQVCRWVPKKMYWDWQNE